MLEHSETLPLIGQTVGEKINLLRVHSTPQGYVEAGDLGREIGKGYMLELEDMISKHAHLKGIYYIFALQHADALMPEAQKVVLCSGREEHRGKFRPTWGADLWKINNSLDTREVLWSLPSRETLRLFLSNPSQVDPQLLKWIRMHQAGLLR